MRLPRRKLRPRALGPFGGPRALGRRFPHGNLTLCSANTQKAASFPLGVKTVSKELNPPSTSKITSKLILNDSNLAILPFTGITGMAQIQTFCQKECAQKGVKIQVSLLGTKINDPAACVVVWKWLCTAWSACNVTFLPYFGRCISCTVHVGYRDKVTSMTVLEIVPKIRV